MEQEDLCRGEQGIRRGEWVHFNLTSSFEGWLTICSFPFPFSFLEQHLHMPWAKSPNS